MMIVATFLVFSLRATIALALTTPPAFKLLDTSHIPFSPLPKTYIFPDNYSLLPPILSKTINNVPNSIHIPHLFPPSVATQLTETFESIGFDRIPSEKNLHESLQILTNPRTLNQIYGQLLPHLPPTLPRNEFHPPATLYGLNPRFRVYKYNSKKNSKSSTSDNDKFLPHVDCGMSESGLDEYDRLSLDVNVNSTDGVMIGGRFSCLIYLNEDFTGGHTTFLSSDLSSVLGSVCPTIGSVLLFPQALGQSEMEFAESNWPQHEGSEVTSGTKFVIRTDCLYRHETPNLMNQHDALVRTSFLPRSTLSNPLFHALTSTLYEPVMGAEALGPLLYGLVKFLKPTNVVEIGAGYTSLFLLAALVENDEELARLIKNKASLKLLDYPWTTETLGVTLGVKPSKLHCVDNCLHQKQSASRTLDIARTLGLSEPLKMTVADAYELSANGSFSENSIDLLFADFGVGDSLPQFTQQNWRSIKDGGHLIVHSTVTNLNTRKWLDLVRANDGQCGLPPSQFHHISLLEPHKHFQNSITIIQKRTNKYDEPIFSEFA